MLIHCKIATKPRAVDLGDKTYLFAANDEGAFVCEVTNRAHASKLLAISEAYILYGADEDEVEPEAEQPKQAAANAPAEETTDEDDDEAEIERILSEDDDDFEDDGVDPTEDEDAEDDDPVDPDAPTMEDMMADPSLITVEVVNKATDDEVDMLFHAKIGRAPVPQSKLETRRKKIIEAIEGGK